MSTLENLAPEPLRFAHNIPNNTHKVRIWKIGPHADQTACHMPRRLITNKPCFCLSQKILPTVTPRRGFHSTHSASISYSWDIYSYHITQSTPTRAHLLTLTPHRGLHSAHNARISTSWDMYSNHIKNKYFIKSSELSTSWALAHPSSLKPHPTLSISHHCSSDPLPSKARLNLNQDKFPVFFPEWMTETPNEMNFVLFCFVYDYGLWSEDFRW